MLKEDMRAGASLDKINSSFAFLVERALTTESLHEADFLDDELCKNLPEYASSIQRKWVVNRGADYPYRLALNHFHEKKAAFDEMFPDKHHDLADRFPSLENLTEASVKPFNDKAFNAFSTNLLQVADSTPWYEIEMPGPGTLAERGDDLFDFVLRVQETLSAAKKFKVHWYAPRPFWSPYFWGVLPGGQERMIPFICRAVELFDLHTEKALFIFDRAETWEEDALVVIQGKLWNDADHSVPEHLFVGEWNSEYSTDSRAETNVLRKVASSLLTNGTYVCWYSTKKECYGIRFLEQGIRISRSPGNGGREAKLVAVGVNPENKK